MLNRKEKIIGILERLGTAVLIYFHWISFYNLMLTRQSEEFNVLLSIAIFIIFFIILLAAAPLHYLHLNPVTTIAFWLFGITKFKNVRS